MVMVETDTQDMAVAANAAKYPPYIAFFLLSNFTLALWILPWLPYMSGLTWSTKLCLILTLSCLVNTTYSRKRWIGVFAAQGPVVLWWWANRIPILKLALIRILIDALWHYFPKQVLEYGHIPLVSFPLAIYYSHVNPDDFALHYTVARDWCLELVGKVNGMLGGGIWEWPVVLALLAGAGVFVIKKQQREAYVWGYLMVIVVSFAWPKSMAVVWSLAPVVRVLNGMLDVGQKWTELLETLSEMSIIVLIVTVTALVSLNWLLSPPYMSDKGLNVAAANVPRGYSLDVPPGGHYLPDGLTDSDSDTDFNPDSDDSSSSDSVCDDSHRDHLPRGEGIPLARYPNGKALVGWKSGSEKAKYEIAGRDVMYSPHKYPQYVELPSVNLQKSENLGKQLPYPPQVQLAVPPIIPPVKLPKGGDLGKRPPGPTQVELAVRPIIPPTKLPKGGDLRKQPPDYPQVQLAVRPKIPPVKLPMGGDLGKRPPGPTQVELAVRPIIPPTKLPKGGDLRKQPPDYPQVQLAVRPKIPPVKLPMGGDLGKRPPGPTHVQLAVRPIIPPVKLPEGADLCRLPPIPLDFPPPLPDGQDSSDDDPLPDAPAQPVRAIFEKNRPPPGQVPLGPVIPDPKTAGSRDSVFLPRFRHLPELHGGGYRPSTETPVNPTHAGPVNPAIPGDIVDIPHPGDGERLVNPIHPSRTAALALPAPPVAPAVAPAPAARPFDPIDPLDPGRVASPSPPPIVPPVKRVGSVEVKIEPPPPAPIPALRPFKRTSSAEVKVEPPPEVPPAALESVKNPPQPPTPILSKPARPPNAKVPIDDNDDDGDWDNWIWEWVTWVAGGKKTMTKKKIKKKPKKGQSGGGGGWGGGDKKKKGPPGSGGRRGRKRDGWGKHEAVLRAPRPPPGFYRLWWPRLIDALGNLIHRVWIATTRFLFGRWLVEAEDFEKYEDLEELEGVRNGESNDDLRGYDFFVPKTRDPIHAPPAFRKSNPFSSPLPPETPLYSESSVSFTLESDSSAAPLTPAFLAERLAKTLSPHSKSNRGRQKFVLGPRRSQEHPDTVNPRSVPWWVLGILACVLLLLWVLGVREENRLNQEELGSESFGADYGRSYEKVWYEDLRRPLEVDLDA